MSSLASHTLLALSVVALGTAGVRMASPLAPRGLERAVAAATFAAAAAGFESLVLGLVDLGGSSLALALAAAATWAATRAVLPPPALSVHAELAAWWGAQPAVTRVSLAAIGGAGLAWAVWLVHVPALGFDSVQYHIPEAVIWVRDGSPGAVLPGVLGPATHLPLMSEVLIAWSVGISRSLVPVSLLAPAAMLLLAIAGWLGLRVLHVGRPAATTAVAALCATPVLTHYQMNGAYNDLPALAFLVTAAALVAVSRRNPGLLIPALLAGALAAGTKTTALPLTLLVLGLGLWPNRRRLRALARPLALVAVPVLSIGGFWYLRDFVDHGSPFWPDVPLPWGDPTPVNAPSFLDRPGATLDRFGDEYLRLLAGVIVMMVGALIVPLVARQRDVWAAGAVTALSLLLWLNAPATGAAESGSTVGTVSTLRYGLPALAAAITTLALATRETGRARLLAGAALAAGLILGAIQTHALGYPSVPGVHVLVAGGVLGVGGGALVSAAGHRLAPIPRWSAPALAALAIAGAGAGLAAGTSGYVERHARANATTSYPYAPMIRWLVTQPRYRAASNPVAMTPIPNGVVVGDRLEHRFDLIPLRESCARVRARLRRQWVLLNFLGVVRRSSAARCLTGVRPSFRGPGFRVYRPSPGESAPRGQPGS